MSDPTGEGKPLTDPHALFRFNIETLAKRGDATTIQGEIDRLDREISHLEDVIRTGTYATKEQVDLARLKAERTIAVEGQDAAWKTMGGS